MASISNDTGGHKRLLFFWPADKRRAVRLGKISKQQAAAFKHHVEQLVNWRGMGHAPGAATSAWLGELDDSMYAKFAAAGLVPERHSEHLGPWLDKYLVVHCIWIELRWIHCVFHVKEDADGFVTKGRSAAHR